MLLGCLGDVCIRMVPCSGQETLMSLQGPWADSKNEAGVGRVLVGALVVLGGGSNPSIHQTLLLEKLRVAKRPANEATFNVFYYLLACADSALR